MFSLISTLQIANFAVKNVLRTSSRLCSINSPDTPLSDLPDPYCKEPVQCILCKYKIKLNHKNPRLLSQFVSPVTGLLYDRHITGLCKGQQDLLTFEIKRARFHGLMGYTYREPRFKKDPILFDPLNPQRPHPF